MCIELKRSQDDRIIRFKADPLTEADTKRLAELETQISGAKEGMTRALREIHDSRLYRATHSSFEAYLNDRWHMSKSYGNELVQWAKENETSAIADRTTSPGQAKVKRAAKNKAKKTLKAGANGRSRDITLEALHKFQHRCYYDGRALPVMPAEEAMTYIMAKGNTAKAMARKLKEDKPAFINRQIREEEKLLRKEEVKSDFDWLVIYRMEYIHFAERARYRLALQEQTQLDEYVRKNPVNPKK